MKNKILLFGIILLFTGCVQQAKTVRYNSNQYTPKPESYEMKILDRSNIDRDFEIIGGIEDLENSIKSAQEVITALKQAAREMGGDAIIDLKTDRQNTSNDWIPAYQTTYTAKVIVFK